MAFLLYLVVYCLKSCHIRCVTRTRRRIYIGAVDEAGQRNVCCSSYRDPAGVQMANDTAEAAWSSTVSPETPRSLEERWRRSPERLSALKKSGLLTNWKIFLRLSRYAYYDLQWLTPTKFLGVIHQEAAQPEHIINQRLVIDTLSPR